MAAATLDVVPDCGDPETWPDACDEFDLQDEFSQVSDAINHNDRKDVIQDERIERNVDAIIDNYHMNYRQDEYLEIQTAEREAFENYVKDQEALWEKDNIGGGISSSALGRYFFGDREAFWNYSTTGVTLMDKLFEVFATKAALEEANQRIDMLEARLAVLEDDRAGVTDGLTVDQRAAVIGAQRSESLTCYADSCVAVVAK